MTHDDPNVPAAARFRLACADVCQHATGGAAEYAKAYAAAGTEMDDPETIRMQCLYILTNLSHWRGDLARATKETLRNLSQKDAWK